MVIVVPRVGSAKSRILVIIVDAAMERVRAALGHHLYLAARATAEVCGLVCRRDLKLFHAADRDGNNG